MSNRASSAERLESRTLLSASLIKDINTLQGAVNGTTAMIWAGNVAYLVQDDAVHGPELWKTDGTTAGTAMADELSPGSAASSLGLIFGIGNGVARSGYSPVYGDELFKDPARTFAAFSNGTLTITGTSNDDHLRVSDPNDGTIRIDFN